MNSKENLMPCIYSLYKYLLNSYYVLDTLLDLKIVGLKRVVKIPAHLS